MDQAERDRGLRPRAFDKMEGLVREMQDPETGVPVRSQKLFLTSIPSAFMGYDLIEWLMERLNIDESVEAVHLANQMCQYGYFFPINDSKNLIVKDDSSLYRFQTPYYWPWQHRSPDNVEYAIYLVKRTLRNKQRHGLEEYELDSLASLKKTLQNKWDFITMQSEEQVRLAKERKKGDKIVNDSQERAYWRIYRPPPGYLNVLEPVPIPNRSRHGKRAKKRSAEDLKRDVDFLRSSLVRTRVKVSQALDNLMQHCATFFEYDPFILGVLPSNPWLSEDPTFWQLNSPLVEVPTEKRIKRWALSIEELVKDPTGLQEFTTYLRKEYSHENIRFWMAVNDLRRSSQSQIHHKVSEIFDEFLAPGAPCEINIDGKTMERVQMELRNPSRFTFDSAAEHVYMLLLKKDCYPRFIRSEQYKVLLAAGIQPLQKKRFFGFGGPAKKKTSTCTVPNTAGLLQQVQQQQPQVSSSMGRRRGSDRSLSGSVHELAISGVREVASRVAHSHSQSNLSDIPYRDPHSGSSIDEPVERQDVCPWETATEQETPQSDNEAQVPAEKKVSISAGTAVSAAAEAAASQSESETEAALTPCSAAETTPAQLQPSRKNSTQMESGSSSSDVSMATVEVSEQLRKACCIQAAPTIPVAEERVIARIQNVRKYSTTSIGRPVVTDSRRSSVTTKLLESGGEDKREEPCARTYKKSCTGRKRSSATPLISVSSVGDKSSETEAPVASTSSSSWQASGHKSNEICPWEDEESCKVDTPFVKTYATLGYL
ncbi:regulator of G-protein signaling 7 isoform X2 [Anabrus simplex]|uniref:regulator of G-protein signaling 7 isoform X2 n=1 Tax=Anabrus simplex TaxID=316456 RepID=UPI0035A3AD0C